MVNGTASPAVLSVRRALAGLSPTDPFQRMQQPGKPAAAGMSAASRRTRLRAEDAVKYFIHVAQLAIERKRLTQLFPAEILTDLRIALDSRPEIAFFLPSLHRVRLHYPIRLFAQHAR